MVCKRIEKLRKLMLKKGIDAYIVVSADYHSSEYVGDYFKAREYMTGFDGSAGTLVVTSDKALLWTDGRYFLQAEYQLKGTGIDLMKIGEQGVPDVIDYLAHNLKQKSVIGFDGKTVSIGFINRLSDSLSGKEVSFCHNIDLVDNIWDNRPSISKMPVWKLDLKYAGVDTMQKVSKLREKMCMESDYIVLTALDEIAWLLNLRGDDVACTPVFLSYMIVGRKSATLFVHKEILSDSITKYLEENDINIMEYDSFYDSLSSIEPNSTVQIDYATANYNSIKCIENDLKIINQKSPVIQLKAIKNEIEISNIKKAHIFDGVALCKFIYWLKHSENVSELDAVAKLISIRSGFESYVEESFDAIVGYAKHGAIVHYEPKKDTNVIIDKKGLCLVDTGGHYLEGTTDVTRTIAVGELSEKEKKAFTLALCGNLALSDFLFPKNTRCECIDAVARQPLWNNCMDFNHGTGHGVGYLLSVHEGPHSISYYGGINKPDNRLYPGMIVSDEPGYYEDGEFGIRHENLLLVKQYDENFLCFDVLTFAPFDKDALDFAYMSDVDISRLNSYHKQVFENISPYLDGEELAWLSDATSEIIK